MYLGIYVVNSVRGFVQPLLESGHRGVVWEAGGSAGGGAAEDVAAGGGAAGDGAARETTASSSKNKKSERKWRATKKDAASVLGYSARRQA